jgi:DNA-binding LacI/PurR family transcriptional regulator/ribosomal protein S25
MPTTNAADIEARAETANDTPKTVGNRGGGRKHAEVCRRLTEIVRQAMPGERLPTTAALCERLGITVVTLNNALKTLESQGLIVRRTGIGLFAPEHTVVRRIALLCAANFYCQPGASPFWQLLLDRIWARASEEQERVEIFLVNYDTDGVTQVLPGGLFEEIRSGRFDGIICVGVNKPLAGMLNELPTPRVAYAGPGPYVLYMQSQQIITVGMQELAKRGCRHIAYWQPIVARTPATPMHFQPNPLRDLYCETLQGLGLEYDPLLFQDSRDRFVALGDRIAATNKQQGYELAARTFGPDADLPVPDGIVSGDDMLTTGILAYLRPHGRSKGDRLPIVTHANRGSTALLGWEDDLTLLEYDPAEMVDGLFAMLHEQIAAREAGIVPPMPTGEPSQIIRIYPRLRDGSALANLPEVGMAQEGGVEEIQTA